VVIKSIDLPATELAAIEISSLDKSGEKSVLRDYSRPFHAPQSPVFDLSPDSLVLK
jgi:hypothetical protein